MAISQRQENIRDGLLNGKGGVRVGHAQLHESLSKHYFNERELDIIEKNIVIQDEEAKDKRKDNDDFRKRAGY